MKEIREKCFENVRKFHFIMKRARSVFIFYEYMFIVFRKIASPSFFEFATLLIYSFFTVGFQLMY